MTSISSVATQMVAAVPLGPTTPTPEQIARENKIFQEKAEGVRLEISAKGKALLEQSEAAANAEGDASRKAIRIDGTEDAATFTFKFQNMSTEDKEFYVQQKLNQFDNYAQIKQAMVERDMALYGATDNTLSTSREEFESEVRRNVEDLATPPSKLPHAVRVYASVASTTGTSNGAPAFSASASDIAAATGSVATAGAHNANSNRIEDSHSITLPNIADLPLALAKKSMGFAELMIANREDVGRTVTSHYGDQAISDLKTYLAAVKDHISKLEAGLTSTVLNGAQA